MNYTSLDIQNLKIKKSMFGYDEDTVNETLEKIAEDYQIYIRENNELKNKISVLNDGIEHYKNMEDSLQNAMLLAQKTSEDVKKNAEENARNIIEKAQFEAEKIVADANARLVDIKKQCDDLVESVKRFKMQYANVLKTELEVLDGLSVGIVDNSVSVDVPAENDVKIEVEPEVPQAIVERQEEEEELPTVDKLISKPISRLARKCTEEASLSFYDDFEPDV